MVETGLPQSGNNTGLGGVGGSSAKGILLVLSALAVCFGYFYFFTDIFRSNDEIAGQRDIISSEVTKAMPVRSSALAQPAGAGAAGVPAISPPDAAPPQPPADQLKQQPAATPQAAGAKAKESPPAAPRAKTPPVKPMDVQKQLPAAKTADRKPPVKAAAKPALPVVPVQKSSAVVKPGGSGKAGPAPVRTAALPKSGTAAAPAQAAAGKAPGGAFTLVVGTYVLKSSMAGDKAKLERSGIKPVTVASGTRKEPMNRLHVADFGTQAEARAELDRVRAASGDAFVLKENSKYAVYAGSYYAYERALEVRDKLQAKGMNPTIRKSVTPVTAYTLTAGSFPSREAALEEAARLKKLGFKPFVAARK
jgi:hypothetical protein